MAAIQMYIAMCLQCVAACETVLQWLITRNRRSARAEMWITRGHRRQCGYTAPKAPTTPPPSTFPRRLRPWWHSQRVNLYLCRVQHFLYHMTSTPPSALPRRLRPWWHSQKVNLYSCRVSIFSIRYFIWLLRLPPHSRVEWGHDGAVGR